MHRNFQHNLSTINLQSKCIQIKIHKQLLNGSPGCHFIFRAAFFLRGGSLWTCLALAPKPRDWRDSVRKRWVGDTHSIIRSLASPPVPERSKGWSGEVWEIRKKNAGRPCPWQFLWLCSNLTGWTGFNCDSNKSKANLHNIQGNSPTKSFQFHCV